jgi:threonine 3-dehydrogenase
MDQSLMTVPQFIGEGKITFGSKPKPEPGEGQLLLQIKANALCGSEKGQFYGGSKATPGHEAAGTVVAAGPNTKTKIGTTGAVFLMDFCGQCRSCRAGFTNQCMNKRADMGFSHDGGYGPFELVHENIFFPTGPDISPTEATLLLDIMGTGGHSLNRGKLIRPDIESILVMGAGPIGLGVLAMARVLFPEETPVYIADFVPYRLRLAEKLGGIPINLFGGSADELLKGALAEPADLAIDTSGKAVARHAALESLGKRGVLICVGHGEQLKLEVSPHLIGPERAVLGSEYFAFNELPGNLRLLQEHRAYFNQIITHRFGVNDIQHAFELFFKGETGKVVIEQ